MDKEKSKKLIDNYNIWVREQLEMFSNAKAHCPYYIVSTGIINKLTPEHLQIFNQSTPSKGASQQLWDKIFRQENYRTVVKSEKIRGIDFKINKFLPKYIDADSLLNYARSKGLFLPQYHFEWMLNNGLIKPLKIIGKKKLFSHCQLLTLDKINWYKQTCLEYPNPKYYIGRQVLKNKKLVNSPGMINTEINDWQEFILNNRENIIEEQEKIEDLIYFLEAMHALDSLILDKAWVDFEKISTKYPNEKHHKLDDIYNNLRAIAYKYYIKEFEAKLNGASLNILKNWAHSVLPAWAIRHNPVLQLSNKWPTLIDTLRSEEKNTDTIFRKGNEIKLANFYVDIINKLNYYIGIKTGGKGRERLDDILSSPTINNQQICSSCGSKFTPNINRSGGRRQVICGNNTCKLNWRKLRQKSYRKRNKR